MAAGSGGQSPHRRRPSLLLKRPDILEVPDVRRQAYVFAKGILQDAGFAWNVEGSVRGYSANTVVAQRPAPGTRVVDNGAPIVVVRLARNTSYRSAASRKTTRPTGERRSSSPRP